MATFKLTAGAVEGYLANKFLPNPVLQIVDCKIISSTNAQGIALERYKLLLSDGANNMPGMFVTNLNTKVAEHSVGNGSIIRVTECQTNHVSDRPILIITDFDYLGKIGQNGRALQANANPNPNFANPGPTMKAPDRAVIIPIRDLNPFVNKWTIKARVTNKGAVRTWQNAKGEGRLFSIELLDQENGEIRATFFKAGVDQFESKIKKDGVYLFSGGKVKAADRRFSSLRNDYEVSFDEKSTVTPVNDDGRISSINYAFLKIGQLENVDPNRNVDVIGVVTAAGIASDLRSKTGKDLVKRDVKLVDDTATEITLTLWGEQTKMDIDQGSVVAAKGARLGDFGGRSLSAWDSTAIAVNPDIPETRKLADWWQREGSSASFRSVSDQRGGREGGPGATNPLTAVEMRKTAASVMNEQHGPDDLLIVKASPSFIRTEPSRMWYPACPGMVGNPPRQCSKKLDNSTGAWVCKEGCAVDHPIYRYILNIPIMDHTGSCMATLFDEQAKTLIGQSAADLVNLANTSGGTDSPQFQAVTNRIMFKEYIFSIKVKMETRMDEQRVKAAVVKVREVDYARENKALLEVIKKYPQVGL